MRIATMATGAVGGYFGGRMAAAGHDVSFIARGAQLEAIRNNGLKIESPLGNLHLEDAQRDLRSGEVGPVDIVLFAVKLWDTETAARQARAADRPPHTRVITLQNGVDSVERIAPILGAEHVIGGAAYIATVIGSPGVISHTSQFAQDGVRAHRWTTPTRSSPPSPPLRKQAGIDIALIGPYQSRTLAEIRLPRRPLRRDRRRPGMPLGAILADPETRAFFRSLMEEVVTLAKAKGIALDPGFLDDRMKFADAAPPGMKASLLHDLERGNRIEIDWLAGKVVSLGRELGVPTPANTAVYSVLKLHRMGRN